MGWDSVVKLQQRNEHGKGVAQALVLALAAYLSEQTLPAQADSFSAVRSGRSGPIGANGWIKL